MPRVFLNPDPALSEREYSMTEQRLSITEEQAEFINDFNEIDDWMMQYSCLLELTTDMEPVSDVAVIAALFDKRTPQEICGAHIDFLEKTPLKEQISTDRFHGMQTVIRKIQDYSTSLTQM